MFHVLLTPQQQQQSLWRKQCICIRRARRGPQDSEHTDRVVTSLQGNRNGGHGGKLDSTPKERSEYKDDLWQEGRYENPRRDTLGGRQGQIYRSNSNQGTSGLLVLQQSSVLHSNFLDTLTGKVVYLVNCSGLEV